MNMELSNEFKKLYLLMNNHDKEVIDKCLALFKIRFKQDYKAISEGKEYPYAYFNEWCSRIEKGTAHGYADNETKKALMEVKI